MIINGSSNKSPAQAVVDKVNVVLIQGQSNIDGRNAGADRPVDVPNPNPNVKILHNGVWQNWDHGIPPVMFTTSNQWSADTVFLQKMYAYTGKTQYAVKKSRGGTAFVISPAGVSNGDWNIANRDYEDHYHQFITRLKNTKLYIEQIEGKKFNPVFLWSDIGETDSANSTKQTYKADYKNFVRKVRNIVGNPRLPIVYRKLQLIQGGVTQWFLDAQEEFAAGEINDFHLIRETYTLQDTYHLDAASSIQYADTVFNLVKDWY